MYILTGTGNPTLPDRTLPLSGDVRIGEQVYSTIKVYDIDASAGLGTVPVSEAVADQIAFTRAWLIRHGIPADMSGLVRVRGDSMEPTIPDGSYVLVQFNIDQSNLKPGIYIIRLDDAIVIKRLQLSPKKEDNWISLISDNPSYPPTVINNPDDTSFVAIARVRTVISEV
ncbi:S24 family peptidase [Profundibacter sp.]